MNFATIVSNLYAKNYSVKGIKMESLGGKYSGILVNKTKKGLSFYIQYRNELGKPIKERIGSSPDMTKSKALAILNERKIRVRELKNSIKENTPSVFTMKKKKQENPLYTLNDLADFYFEKIDVRTSKEMESRYNYHVRNEEFANIPIIYLVSEVEKKEDILEDFIQRKLNQRSDKRRNVKQYKGLSVEEKEIKELEKNEAMISRLRAVVSSYPKSSWVEKNKIKFLEKKNEIIRLRHDEKAKEKLWKAKDIPETEKRLMLGLLGKKTIKEILLLCITITNFGIEKKRLGISNPFILPKKDSRFHLKIDNIRDRYLTVKEIKEFLKEVKRIQIEYPKHKNIYLIALLALTTGARQSTIVSIRVGDIDIDNMTISLRNHKLTKSYSGVIASEDIREEILKLIKGKEDSDYLFINRNGTRLYRFPRKIQEILDYTVNYKRDFVNWLSIKDFRNTVASHLVMRSVPIEQVSQVLDHSDIGITQRYAHLAKNAAKNEIGKMIGDFTE